MPGILGALDAATTHIMNCRALLRSGCSQPLPCMNNYTERQEALGSAPSMQLGQRGRHACASHKLSAAMQQQIFFVRIVKVTYKMYSDPHIFMTVYVYACIHYRLGSAYKGEYFSEFGTT